MLPRVSDAPLVLVKVIQDKLRASHAAPVSSTMLRVLLVANCVSIRRTLVKREETAVASIAQPVGRPKTAVRNAWRAARGRLVLDVQIACPVNIVQVAIKMLLRVLIAPLVLVKVIQDKHRVLNAVLVNSVMYLVLVPVNPAPKILITAIKAEIRRALIVPRVGLRRKAVPNASSVAPAPSATVAKIVHWGLLEQQSKTRPNANGATQVLRPRHPARPSAVAVIWANMAPTTAPVPTAPPIDTKTPVANKLAKRVPSKAKNPMQSKPPVPNLQRI